jgi:phosphate-selective porin OprO/OprP
VPGFCITCAESGKWIPFLERSMGTNVFGPKQGLGISANTYNNNYSFTVAATQQPPSGDPVFDPRGNVTPKPDLWQGAFRLTWAPIAEIGKVFQVGFSAHILELSNTGLQYNTNPEMRSGSSISLLNTTQQIGPIGSRNSQIRIAARNQKTIDLEMLGIWGPWSGELEYQKAYVLRGYVNDVIQGPNLSFSGYHAQLAYILTGESRPHKKSNGTLGQIHPKSSCGAFEVAARYSFVTLNDKDVSGGMAHNTSASLAWYANENIKLIGEYVFSKQSRAFPTYFDKRHLSSLGMRLQVVF